MNQDERERQRLHMDRGRKACEPLAGALAVFLTGAAAGILVLVSASSRGTQGARASTRLTWEERRIEIDAAAVRAGLEPRR